MAIALYAFNTVGGDNHGRGNQLVSEPPIGAPQVYSASVGSISVFSFDAATRYIGMWASSGGHSAWFQFFTNSTQVTSFGAVFPVRKIALGAEGDYEMFSIPPKAVLAITG